jgi:Putative lumazine-binding
VTARTVATFAAALMLAAPLTACGRDEEGEVRDTLDAFAQATAKKDYQRLCDELFAAKLVEEVRQTVPCEVALRNSSLDDARNPKLTVRSVKVDGDQATAEVSTSAANQRPSQDTVRLVKEEGEWRIVALAS